MLIFSVVYNKIRIRLKVIPIIKLLSFPNLKGNSISIFPEIQRSVAFEGQIESCRRFDEPLLPFRHPAKLAGWFQSHPLAVVHRGKPILLEDAIIDLYRVSTGHPDKFAVKPDCAR